MDESNFDRLLERYVTGQVTPQEKKKIEAWFEVRKTRGEENTELTDQEQQVLFDGITSKLNDEDAIRNLRPEAGRYGRTRLVIGIAASLIALIAVTVATLQFKPFSRASSAYDTKRIILKDGSIVWLRGKSTFNYYETSDGLRHGVLNGEALFEIAKDPLHPFTIQHDNYAITVLGTSFNLRAVSDSLDLKVLTGKVRLTTSYDSTGLVLQHLESVQLVGKVKLSKTMFLERDVTPLIADTQYDMNFTNSDMRSVAERLSKKFNIDFTFSNNKIGNCLITADFTDRSLDNTTSMLEDVLDAKFKRDGNTILIEGLGCD